MRLEQLIASQIIQGNRAKEIASAEGLFPDPSNPKNIFYDPKQDLTLKCKKCFHYNFFDPNKIKWDYMHVPVGHVCNYEWEFPLRSLVPIHIEENESPACNIKNDVDRFSYVYQTNLGIRTIKNRINLGECEFKEFSEPRPIPWHERCDKWDEKYKAEFVRLLEQELRNAGESESEIQQIIEEELDFKNTIYHNECKTAQID